LLEELNSYLSEMVSVIHDHGGVVDKFVGDSIMVVFGIPGSAPDDALRAVRCAAALQQALARHNAARAHRGLKDLAHGIGLHFGPVVAGNVGTLDRLQPTVVGDIVNTASRLEALTKVVSHNVLISAEAVAATGCSPESLGIRYSGTLPITGREGGIGVFSLVHDPLLDGASPA
jgi:adenylate cyclase